MLARLISLYQVSLGPLIGGSCRFQPSCSEYAKEAVTRHGTLKGGWMSLKRILSCRPFGGAGFDPVP